MKTLYVIASPRGEMSKSVELGNYLVRRLGGEVEVLDVHKEHIPYLTFPVIAVNYGFAAYEDLSDENRAISDLQRKYINQVKAADRIVIAAPMWNFGMPAALKAWFDLVVKINDTFEIRDGAYTGLVDNRKKVAVVGARGGIYAGTPSEAYDQLTPQINWLLGFIGLTDVSDYWLEGVNILDAEGLEAEKDQLKQQMEAFIGQ